jgi:PAS domain S-box-containing protein
VLFDIRKVLSNAIDLETGARGFVLTGKEEFLEPFNNGKKNWNLSVGALRKSMADNSDQSERLDTLERLIKRREQLGELIVKIRNEQGVDKAIAIVVSGQGKQVMDSIRNTIRRMEGQEVANLYAGAERNKEKTLHYVNYLVGISVFIFLSIILFYYFLRRNAAQLGKLNFALVDTVNELNATNEELQASQDSVQQSMDELMAIQDKLKESEERYRLVSENSHDLIVLHRLNGDFIFVSSSVKEMLGYDPDELIGKSAFNFVHKDDLQQTIESVWNEVLKGATIFHTRFRMKKKDNSYVWVESYSKPIVDSEGTVVSIQSSTRNISSRKIVEEKLEESERLYRLISTNTKDLISLYGAEENPLRVYVSPSCKNIMGYEPYEMIGHSSFDFILAEDVEEMKKSIHPQTLSGRSATFEYRARKKDGSIIWLESISNPFFDKEGQMIGFQTSARDVTQRKLFEDALILAKEESEKASARLKELLGEKNDLIGLFSHDMRAPINQVKGLMKIMSISLDDKDTLNDCLVRLNYAVNRQLALYQDVLYMLKSDQASFDSKSFTLTRLITLIQRVNQNLDFELQAKKINFSWITPPHMEVLVEPDLFVQAIQNLLSNAIKFSNENSAIRLYAEQKGGTIQVMLEDEGIGFEPEKAELLFERFTKEGRKGTNNEESTGLGLYLVRKIIENHKGTIRAHSDGEGKGARFLITLPINIL